MVVIDSRKPVHGRGATINPTGRFEKRQLEPFDDGWADDEPGADELPTKLATQVIPEKTKRAITRNDSPDISFDRSLNPYKGCEHGCVYCASGDTRVLMADGTQRALADIQPGDIIYGTARLGWYRRYTKARVLDHWPTHKAAYRITLEDGTVMVASGDHRFLTLRGWKFVVNNTGGRDRAHLTTNDKLLGVGRFATAPRIDDDYRRGYLTGMIRDDGHLALTDVEALERAEAYLHGFGIATRRFIVHEAQTVRSAMHAIGAYAATAVQRIRELIAWPLNRSASYELGFLAGIFDAEGSFSQGIVRISNADSQLVSATVGSLSRIGISSVVERPTRRQGKPIEVVRLLGDLRQHLRFFQSTSPAITRKSDITGAALKSSAPLRVVAIEPLDAMPLFDITTTTGDFVADGVVHHNCFARPTHSYVGLSPGIDFETKIFSKPEAPERLREELSKPTYVPTSLTLGANTDPYQPVEREQQISRRVLEVLREFKHPVGIITKSALIQRDIDILSDMAHQGLAQVSVSVTTLDRSLARIMEPRAATPERRLETIEALAKADIPVSVLAAPMIPFINDSELERILDATYARGARRAGYVLLRLPHELKDLVEAWLTRHFPERKDHVLNTVRWMRGGHLYDSTWGRRMTGTGPYAQALAARFTAATRRLGFNLNRRDLDTTKFTQPAHGKGAQLRLL